MFEYETLFDEAYNFLIFKQYQKLKSLSKFLELLYFFFLFQKNVK